MRKTVPSLLVLAPWLCAAAAAQDRPAKVYIVRTHAGDVHRVSNLTAKYGPDGQWYGSRPTWERDTLYMELRGRQGEATWKEKRDLPLSTLRKIMLGPYPIPLEPIGPVLSVEKRDGSSILITRQKGRNAPFQYEENDSSGKPVKSVQITDFVFLAGKVSDSRFQEADMWLEGFGGKVTTPLGGQGAFYINRREVRSIEFE